MPGRRKRARKRLRRGLRPVKRRWRRLRRRGFGERLRAGRRRVKARVVRARDPGAFERHRLVGPPEFWQEKRRFQIDLLVREGLERQHRVLDVGCGTLRGGIPIIELLEAGNYMGTEVRPEVLDAAREELAAAGLTHKRPQLVISGDFETFETDLRFDFAWAFSVLIHMEDEISEACVRWVGEHLKDSGKFYANVNLGEKRDAMGGQGFPVLTRPLEFYSGHAAKAGLGIADMGTLESLGHVTGLDGDQHHMLRFSRA